MSWKKMIMGEKMPDKDDPKYRDRYEREVDAGRKFARATKIDKAAAKVQQFANDHKKLFLAIVFGFIILSLLEISFVWARYITPISHRNPLLKYKKSWSGTDISELSTLSAPSTPCL